MFMLEITNKLGQTEKFFNVESWDTERPSEGGRTYVKLKNGTRFTVPFGWKVCVTWFD